MAQMRFEQMLRPIHEGHAAVGWGLTALWMLGCALIVNASPAALFASASLATTMAFWRLWQAKKLIDYKLSLCGKEVVILPVQTLQAHMPRMGDNLWLGWGFRWEPKHTQRAHEILKRNLEEIYPPRWALSRLGIKDPREARGLPWIHGVDGKERDITLSFDNLKGHCAVIATTGAIKTRLASLIISQLAARGDTVVVIDPKGDKELREICRQAALLSGNPDRFQMLHPAFASQSVRLDLLKNWDQVSQVASRIQLVLGSQESDNFKDFCWLAVHSITNGMKYVDKRANLYELKVAMESRQAVERLTEEALSKFFEEKCPQNLKEEIEREFNAESANKPARPQKRGGGIEVGSPRLSALIRVFQTKVPSTPHDALQTGLPMKPDEIGGLISILESNHEWFGKMIVSMRPLLTKLTTDDLRGLLSPDYSDINDARPIMDGKRIVEGRHIFYMGTDTLTDESVGKTLSAAFLAEMSSVAGEIYNHGIDGDDGSAPRRIHIFVDEWGDVFSPPMIQQANKGRGAGYFIWALGQTIADLVTAAGGNKHIAMRFLGNMNNLIVGATQDIETMDFITEKLGETMITLKSQSSGMGSKTEDIGLEFSSNQSESVTEKQAELFPRSLLPKLPDLHYVALFNRGELLKGRIPVVVQ